MAYENSFLTVQEGRWGLRNAQKKNTSYAEFLRERHSFYVKLSVYFDGELVWKSWWLFRKSVFGLDTVHFFQHWLGG